MNNRCEYIKPGGSRCNGYKWNHSDKYCRFHSLQEEHIECAVENCGTQRDNVRDGKSYCHTHTYIYDNHPDKMPAGHKPSSPESGGTNDV